MVGWCCLLSLLLINLTLDHYSGGITESRTKISISLEWAESKSVHLVVFFLGGGGRWGWRVKRNKNGNNRHHREETVFDLFIFILSSFIYNLSMACRAVLSPFQAYVCYCVRMAVCCTCSHAPTCIIYTLRSTSFANSLQYIVYKASASLASSYM